MIRAMQLAVIAVFAAILCTPAANAYTTSRKFNPGQYSVILMSSNDDQRAMDDANRPGMRGIMKKYYWRELEPTQGNYNFAKIQADLNWGQAYGMQIIVMIVDKTFKPERPNPAYLDTNAPRNRAGGYTVVRWNPTVVTRYKALVAALGKRFDSHPNFEGIAQQESSLGFESTTLQKYGYTPEKYRDALIASFGYALSVMPRSRVFWYQNYFVGNQDYIGAVAATLGPKGLVMAGPDTLPDNASLVTKSYPFFAQFQGRMHMGIQVEDICYRAPHTTAGYSTKYWTPGELFRYARDKLQVNYVFWVRIPAASPVDSYDWYDALPVIQANPSFN
ncbi:MAG: hypothetical protein ACR2I8_08100 [Steroidobacteraceae bacterium]